MSEPEIHTIDEADRALQFILGQNKATYWEKDQFGRISIHKPKPGRGGPYDVVPVPEVLLKEIELKFRNDIPPDDYEGLLNVPKRRTAISGKKSVRRSRGYK